ncbi:MAG: DUF5691 domain-containing protein [Anaerolineae bacterium]
MSRFPEELIRTAATGSTSQTRARTADEDAPLHSNQSKRDNYAERQLLTEAATYSLQYQAGYIPETLNTLLPERTSLPDTRACQRAAGEHLLTMINGEHENLLYLWLDTLQQHQQHIPFEMIPNVLTYGANNRRYQSLLAKALDERGRWLAQQARKPDWEWVLEDTPSVSTDENPYKAWENAFRRWRQRDPSSAMDTLRQHWDELDSLMQTALLQALSVNASERDVDFLQALLSDEALRFSAAECLLHIKESEFSQAAQQVVDQIILLTHVGKPARRVVDFAWSPIFDGDPRQIALEEGQSLCQIMGYPFNPDLLLMMLPLSYWYERYNITSEELVKAAQNSNRAVTFYRIWENKASHEQDTAFLFALVMHIPHKLRESILHQLSSTQLMQATMHWLKQEPVLSAQHSAITLLNRIHHLWDEALAQAFIASLQVTFEQSVVDTPTIESLLRSHAHLMPLSTDTQLEQVLLAQRHHSLTESAVNDTLEMLAFRAEMLQAIQAG